jgi:hypothetical protein
MLQLHSKSYILRPLFKNLKVKKVVKLEHERLSATINMYPACPLTEPSSEREIAAAADAVCRMLT